MTTLSSLDHDEKKQIWVEYFRWPTQFTHAINWKSEWGMDFLFPCFHIQFSNCPHSKKSSHSEFRIEVFNHNKTHCVSTTSKLNANSMN